MARSIGMIASITSGTAFTSAASPAGSVGRRFPVASRRSETATGVNPTVRRNDVASESFGRRRSSRSRRPSTVMSGWRSTVTLQRPWWSIGLSDRCRVDVDRAAFEPSRVTIASPRTEWPATTTATFFNGMPANRSANSAVQPTRMPQLAARSSPTSTPARRSPATQPPSEPTRGQLAPPSASRVTSPVTSTVLPSARPNSDLLGSIAPSGIVAHPSQR